MSTNTIRYSQWDIIYKELEKFKDENPEFKFSDETKILKDDYKQHKFIEYGIMRELSKKQHPKTSI